MKKGLPFLILFTTIIVVSMTVKGSVDNLEITKVDILQGNHEVHIKIKNLELPIGFRVWCNETEITKDCEIYNKWSFLGGDCILIISIPNNIGTYYITVLFYDEVYSKILTTVIDYEYNKMKINWGLSLSVICGILTLNIVGGSLMFRKGKSVDGITKNPILSTTYNEMIIKTVFALITAAGLFIYVCFHPYFYYPQLINSSWCYAYDMFDYFSKGALFLAIFGLTFHIFRFALGIERKLKSDSSIKYVGAFSYYFRKIIGGEDETNKTLNKEKHPSIVVISKTLLICTIFFTLRIAMNLLLSTLYEYFPNNFMLVIKHSEENIHTPFSWFSFVLGVFSLIFFISFVISFVVFNGKLLAIILKNSKDREAKEKKKILRLVISPPLFYVLYFACIKIAPIVAL